MACPTGVKLFYPEKAVLERKSALLASSFVLLTLGELLVNL
jgi:hypothetical protein